MNRLYYGDNLQILREHVGDEAASAGFAEIDMGTGTARFPRIQILTVAGFLSGTEHPRLPIVDSTVFKRARREERERQGELGI